MSKIDDMMRQGLQLHQSGRLADAEAIYRKVLDKQASHPAANHLMGLILLQRGDAAGAVVRLQRAVHVRPDDPEYLGNLGAALNAAGRPAEALEAFDRALSLRPQSPAILNNKAMALRALHRRTEAVEAYRAAIALLSNEAGFHRNLATVLGDLGEWREAETAYRQALAHRPNLTSAVKGLCQSLEAQGRTQEAIEVAKDYRTRYPAEAEYHRAYGHASWNAGEAEQAAVGFRAAIAAAPTDAEAHRMLGLVVRRRSRDDEVQAVERLLLRRDLTDDQRAQLEFALGRAFADIGDEARSVEHYAAANAIVRRLKPFDLAVAAREIATLRETFAALPDADVPELGPPDGPIFIVGLPRSGKSSLEGMLARHPTLFPAGELPLLGNMAAELRNRGGEGADLAVAPELLGELGRRYMEATAKLAPGGRIVDTMPNNFKLVGAIRLALPSARVISCQREPAGHAAALHRKYYARSGNEYAADPADARAYVELAQDLMSFWQQRFSGLVLDIDMSNLATEAEGQMRKVADFLGLSWMPELALPYQSEPRLG